MTRDVEELRKIIDQFERNVQQIRTASEEEIKRARSILKRLERQEKPR